MSSQKKKKKTQNQTDFSCALRIRIKRYGETFGGWKQNARLLKSMYCLDLKAQTKEKESIFQEKGKPTQQEK